MDKYDNEIIVLALIIIIISLITVLTCVGDECNKAYSNGLEEGFTQHIRANTALTEKPERS